MRWRRWSTTIWSFLSGQMLRLMLLTVAVLVVVTSFSAAIKPLADGKLGVIDALWFMVYASVPMLQYALPFAGGFAATLAYHRMSQDNELTACYAGGLSHKRVLMPAAMLGLATGVGLFVLADQVMPRFLRQMQQLITRDGTHLLETAIGKGQSLKIGNRLIYADNLDHVPLELPSKASKHLLLRGVVAVEVDRQTGQVKNEVASRFADVWLYPAGVVSDPLPALGSSGEAVIEDDSSRRGAGLTVVMRLRDYVVGQVNVATGGISLGELSFRLDDSFTDDPKYLTWSELAEADRRPEVMNFVDGARRKLAETLAGSEAIDRLSAALKLPEGATLTDSSGRRVTIVAGGVQKTLTQGRGFSILPRRAGEPIEVIVTLGGTVAGESNSSVRVHRAARAYVRRSSDTRSTAVDLIMEDVATRAGRGESSGGSEAGVLSEISIIGMKAANDPMSEFLAFRSDLLLATARQRLDVPMEVLEASERSKKSGSGEAAVVRGGDGKAVDPGVLRDARRLATTMQDVRREVMSKQHERIAASLACPVMVILGAVMGMRLGAASPLVVYMWSFLPALAALISIAGGQSVTHDHGVVGLGLLYGGVCVLAGYTFWEYARVSRH